MGRLKITQWPLSRFDGIAPLLLRCFPDFWEPRLAEGKRSFPYDLKLFAAHLEKKVMGCIGVHPYSFLAAGKICSCGGVSDVAVDPDYRGKGHAFELQEFFMEYCRTHFPDTALLPLYTDKPGVYMKLGWRIYESDSSNEIQSAFFPEKNAFAFESPLSLLCLKGRRKAHSPEEEKALKIMDIYQKGHAFNGKCLRSAKTWLELFSDKEYRWCLEENTYFLYRGGVLYEGYSADPAHPVSHFTPRHGGHDDNKVMVNLPRLATENDRILSRMIAEKKLIFPAADVF